MFIGLDTSSNVQWLLLSLPPGTIWKTTRKAGESNTSQLLSRWEIYPLHCISNPRWDSFAKYSNSSTSKWKDEKIKGMKVFWVISLCYKNFRIKYMPGNFIFKLVMLCTLQKLSTRSTIKIHKYFYFAFGTHPALLRS